MIELWLGVVACCYLFLGAVGSLLGDDADALVAQDADAEHRDPAAVDKLHRFDGQDGCDDVVRVVLPAGYRHQSVA